MEFLDGEGQGKGQLVARLLSRRLGLDLLASAPAAGAEPHDAR